VAGIREPDACPAFDSVSVSFTPVLHCPPPVARASSSQVKGGDGFLRMSASRLGKRVGRRPTRSGYHPCPGAVCSWERDGSDDARIGALICGDRDRRWLHDLPGRLLLGSSFPRALCCGPGCHEFSRERSQRSSMPNTCRIHQPGMATACVCASQRTLGCGQPGCLQNGFSPEAVEVILPLALNFGPRGELLKPPDQRDCQDTRLHATAGVLRSRPTRRVL
jgi:hypothetical protein